MKIHIVPSGSEKSLCGLDSDKINSGDFSSIGMLCNCKDCLRIAQDIIDRMIGDKK